MIGVWVGEGGNFVRLNPKPVESDAISGKIVLELRWIIGYPVDVWILGGMNKYPTHTLKLDLGTPLMTKNKGKCTRDWISFENYN